MARRGHSGKHHHHQQQQQQQQYSNVQPTTTTMTTVARNNSGSDAAVTTAAQVNNTDSLLARAPTAEDIAAARPLPLQPLPPAPAALTTTTAAAAAADATATPPSRSPVLRARRFPSVQRQPMTMRVTTPTATTSPVYDSNMVILGGMTDVMGQVQRRRSSSTRSSGSLSSAAAAARLGRTSSRDAAAATSLTTTAATASSSYTTTPSVSSPAHYSPVTMTTAHGMVGGSPRTHDAPTSWQQLLARNNYMHAMAAAGSSANAYAMSEHGSGVGGGHGAKQHRPRSRSGCSTPAGGAGEARGLTVIYPHHLGGRAGGGNASWSSSPPAGTATAGGVSDVVRTHAMAEAYARYARAAGLHMYGKDDAAADNSGDHAASTTTAAQANMDLAEVHVEGYYAQNIGVLIPNDLPRSTLLYVLTASDGRDLLFKLIQYTLQLIICFLKTPALFSADALAVTEPWAERLYRNYNTIRHGRSLFKIGRGLLNFFTLQTVCERLWRRYGWPRLPPSLRTIHMTPSSSFAAAVRMWWLRVVLLRAVRACTWLGLPCGVLQRPLLRHLQRIALVDDDLVPSPLLPTTTTTTAACAEGGDDAVATAADGTAQQQQQRQQQMLLYGSNNSNNNNGTFAASRTKDDKDDLAAELVTDDMYMHAPTVESVAAIRARRALVMPYLPRSVSSAHGGGGSNKAHHLIDSFATTAAAATTTTAMTMTTTAHDTTRLPHGVDANAVTAAGGAAGAAVAVVDAHTRALQQKAAAASTLHLVPSHTTSAADMAHGNNKDDSEDEKGATEMTVQPWERTAATAAGGRLGGVMRGNNNNNSRDAHDAVGVTDAQQQPHAQALSMPFALPQSTAHMAATTSQLPLPPTITTTATTTAAPSYNDEDYSPHHHYHHNNNSDGAVDVAGSGTLLRPGALSGLSTSTGTHTHTTTHTSDSLNSHSQLDMYADSRATFAESEMPPPPQVSHTLPLLLTPASATATMAAEATQTTEATTATPAAAAAAVPAAADDVTTSAGGRPATALLLRAGRDAAETQDKQRSDAAAAVRAGACTHEKGNDSTHKQPSQLPSSTTTATTTTAVTAANEVARRASQTATHVPPASTLYSLLQSQEHALSAAATTDSNVHTQQQQTAAAAAADAAPVATGAAAAPLQPGSAYDDSDVSIMSRASSADVFDSLGDMARTLAEVHANAAGGRRRGGGGSADDGDDVLLLDQHEVTQQQQLRHLVPAAAAEAAQWRRAALDFPPLLMLLLGVRNAAAGVRRCLRDVTLFSSERFIRATVIEQHRTRLLRRINYLWLFVAVVDLLLNTVRLLQPGWVRYAMARQDLSSHCGCRASEDADDAIVRRGTYFARRKTDLRFAQLNLDYGAPLPSTMAYMEAANPRHLRPVCSRCGFLYKHDSDDDDDDESDNNNNDDDDGEAHDGHRDEAEDEGDVATRTQAATAAGVGRRRRRCGDGSGRAATTRKGVAALTTTTAMYGGSGDGSGGGSGNSSTGDEQQQQQLTTQQQQQQRRRHRPVVKDGLDTVGVMFIPWLLRKLYNYLWLVSVHANFRATLLMELRCAAELFLAYKYCFGGYETNRADAPLARILNPYCALAGAITAAVGLLRVVESAPK